MNLFYGDCLEEMKTFEENYIDSLVTDPPAGISFMGKSWDTDKGGRDNWINWMSEVMRECLRVLKPGAHGLVWSIPRTSHWTATALENAGFEVRDCITHLFGSGFPKSLDISKAIDKAAGCEREIISTVRKTPSAARCHEGWKRPWAEGKNTMDITAATTEDAKEWEGWGTALKPAAEFWWLVRKPLSEKTVAANVLKWGTGGININGSRIGKDIISTHGGGDKLARIKTGKSEGVGEYKTHTGRFPANLVFSHTPECTEDQCTLICAINQLNEQSGNLGKSTGGNSVAISKHSYGKFGKELNSNQCGFGDSGGASRFFYCAKISTRERNTGLDDFPDVIGGIKNTSGRGFSENDPNKIIIVKNNHPTVKSKKLMGYLIKLITPPNGVVLDPFMGSGSTGIAAKENNFRFIGIEKEKEYFDIASARIGH